MNTNQAHISLECQLLKADNDLRWAEGNLRAVKFVQSTYGSAEASVDYFAECRSQALAEVERLRAALAA
jgi:hypothetical protein